VNLNGMTLKHFRGDPLSRYLKSDEMIHPRTLTGVKNSVTRDPRIKHNFIQLLVLPQKKRLLTLRDSRKEQQKKQMRKYS
jgi:hypothetical protein